MGTLINLQQNINNRKSKMKSSLPLPKAMLKFNNESKLHKASLWEKYLRNYSKQIKIF